MASIWLLSLTVLWTGAASAQSSFQDPIADCPAFPADAAESLRWEVLRVPNMLLCRAISTDTGAEAFALTISPESPFKPRRGDRAETGNLNGREVQWYRGEVPNEPKVLIREALIELSEDRVVHVSMRTNDEESLAKRQQMVLSLPFPAYRDD